MKRVIVITSGKGGVGKTTTAINLGVAMNHFGGDVLVVDGNLCTPNVGIHLGSPEVPVNLNDVIQEKADVFEAVYEHESGIKIMPASLSIKELKRIKPDKIKRFKNDFKKISDYVIVDSSAGLGDDARSLIEMADDLIIVTNPELPAIADALKTIKLAENLKKPITGVIVTRVKRNKIEMSPDSVKEMLDVPVLGMIPEDISISKSLSQRNAVIRTHPKSSPSIAYKEIAAKILNVPYDSNQDKERVLERVLKRLGLMA